MSDYQNLLYQITSRIRQSLDLKEILDAAVQEIFKLLRVERVKVYRFDGDGSGEVIAEAVDTSALPSLKHLRFPAADIPPAARERFVQDRLRVIVDVSAQRKIISSREDLCPVPGSTAKSPDYIQVDPCHLEYLSAMGVAASLVMPILHQDALWGLLAVHHSVPRRFSEREMQMLQLLTDQLEIAIAQSSLLLRAQQQAEHEAIIGRVGQILHYPLSRSSLHQQVLETLVKELKASGGRLHLLGDRTTPHSQTYTVGDQPLTSDLEDSPLWQGWMEQQIRSLGADLLGDYDPRFNRQALAVLEQTKGGSYSHRQPLAGTLADLRQPPWNPLADQFERTPIRSFLVIPLAFQEYFLGYITLFRRGHSVNIDWAGQCDRNQRLQFPKLSFEIWRELRQDQPHLWQADELKLVQTIGLHLSMSILQRRVEAMVRYQSSHDSLTELPNRLLFTERLTLALMEAGQSNEMIGIAILDINRFRRINESLGAEAGDLLLRQVAERLQSNLRPQDFLARWGSDEFTLLLPGLHSAEAVLTLVSQIMTSVGEPFSLQGREIFITSSLGIALAPYDGEDADTLIRCASTAVQKAQQEGLHTFHLYQRDTATAALEPLTLEGDLRRALVSQQLELYYQPQLEIATGRLIGLEALIRWHHPTLGFISPGEFVPLAEETGLIHNIGRWALQMACQQQQLWEQAGFPNLRVCVNLSPKQFYRADLPQLVWEALEAHGVSPDCLELEITESAAMQDMDSAIRMLEQLRCMGIRIALDDFGTGYSSLTAIKHFPLDTLKLDKAFIQDLMDNPGDAAIAQTIVALGRGLGLMVIAEGVETDAQLKVLRNLQCHCAQGYLFSQPLSAQGMMRFIQEYCLPEGSAICCKSHPIPFS